MKKTFLVAGLLLGLFVASCGNSQNNNNDADSLGLDTGMRNMGTDTATNATDTAMTNPDNTTVDSLN